MTNLEKNNGERTYLAIDLKSFYASVECVERGLDPMTTDLVVADERRGPGTICLAVSPSLKAKGVRNRCRLFEVPNEPRIIVVKPRMKKYLRYSAQIYGIYLEFFDKADIHVYSVDEVFIDATSYLKMYGFSGREMAEFLMNKILERTGLRTTAGVGTNLYLAKVALDIIAKKAPDFIGILTEEKYREELWGHRPLTDFWRIGKGIAKKLEQHAILNMGAVARADEELLYKLFGVDAELLIDHAWGREPVTMADIKKYRPSTKSFSIGQVLPRDYKYREIRVIVREMIRELCLRMYEAEVETDLVMFMVIYGKSGMGISNSGLEVSRSGLGVSSGGLDLSNNGLIISISGSVRLDEYSYDDEKISGEVLEKINEKIDRGRSVRRLYFSVNNLEKAKQRQRSIFDREETKTAALAKATLELQSRFGKNALIRAEDLEPEATTRERHKQVGGHEGRWL